MLEGLLTYDHKDDIWLLVKNDGRKLDISNIIYNLIALGLDGNIDEEKQLKMTITIG